MNEWDIEPRTCCQEGPVGGAFLDIRFRGGLCKVCHKTSAWFGVHLPVGNCLHSFWVFPEPVRWRFSFLSQFSLLSLLAFVPQCTELPRCSGLSALIDARWTAPADVFVLVFSSQRWAGEYYGGWQGGSGFLLTLWKSVTVLLVTIPPPPSVLSLVWKLKINRAFNHTDIQGISGNNPCS